MAIKKKKKSSLKHKQVVHAASRRHTSGVQYVFYGVGFAALALLLSAQVTYTQNFSGSVLGDDSSHDLTEQQKQDQEQQQQQEVQNREQEPTHAAEVNAQRNELEVQHADGTKLKVKAEDNGKQKIEGEGEKLHFTFSGNDGKLKLEAVNEDGEKLATGDAEAKRLEKQLEEKDIKISSEDGSMDVEHNGFRVRTNFPLSVNPVTGQLTVTTPAGTKTVAVLPDDAIQNMLRNGFFTTVTSASGSATASGSGFLNNSFALTLRNGEPVYQISGEKTGKVFGLIPVTLSRIVYVSAQTGQAVAQTQSWLATILSSLTF